ncbi:hypothetical protein JHK86_003567 [Glycine max]|uniref:DUF4283 domain-containing protein n=1 Tax=Glycine max TaxID=3847 RepID=A0A0R0KZV5_SOYBN|nr:hypothetical protein JHK86_003567 [Glycine max]
MENFFYQETIANSGKVSALNGTTGDRPPKPPNGDGEGLRSPFTTSLRDKVLGKPTEPKEIRNLLREGTMQMELEGGNRLLPKFSLDATVFTKLCESWKKFLVLKLLGKRIGFLALRDKLKSQWKCSGGFDLMDVDNGYFLITFDFEDDKNKAIRMVYYDDSVLLTIALAMGTPLRVDMNTANLVRGRFTRVCIEIDLTVLVGKFYLNGKWYNVEYEGLHILCASCVPLNDDQRRHRETRSARYDRGRYCESKDTRFGPPKIPKKNDKMHSCTELKSKQPIMGQKANHAATTSNERHGNRVIHDEPMICDLGMGGKTIHAFEHVQGNHYRLHHKDPVGVHDKEAMMIDSGPDNPQ